jgi:signal transduction histidine kinase
LLVVLVGAVLPLGVVGAWLARSTERAGERLLRERLDRALLQIADEIGMRWVRLRSDLLTIAEHPAAHAALRGLSADTSAPPPGLASLVRRLEVEVARVAFVAPGGETVLSLETGAAGGRGAPPAVSAPSPVELAVYERLGARLGTMHADIWATALVPSGVAWAGVGGVLGIFEWTSGRSLLPLTIDPETFRQARFVWGEEPWLSVQRDLSELGLDLVLAAPLTPVAGPFADATRQGTIALLAVGLGAVLLATLLTARLTRSLERLAEGAGAVAAGELDRRVEVAAEDEVGRVARAFNQMTDSLRRTLRELAQRESLAAVGEFAARLAHEVRNPLTAVRVDLQRAEERIEDPAARDLVARTLRAVARLDATVAGALRVARSGNVERRPLALRGPVEAAMESARPEFAAHGARLQPIEDGAGALTVNGDAAALEQLFLNLLLNAAQAAGAGGHAGIHFATEDRAVTVSVWDTGPGIPPEAREAVLAPFYSTKPDGTGLGLAIARQIAQAHGATLAIEGGAGPGAVVRVTLPRAGGEPAPA